jgi:hypothetical protein
MCQRKFRVPDTFQLGAFSAYSAFLAAKAALKKSKLLDVPAPQVYFQTFEKYEFLEW